MDVFPVDWALADRNGRCTVTCFGKLPDRRSVAVHLRWVPTFYVPLPRDASAQRLAARLVEEHGAVKSLCQVVHKKSLWGFRGGETEPFLLLAFSTLAAHSRAKYALRRAKVKTFEADVDPLLRLFHVRDIAPGRWVRLEASAPEPRPTTVCDLELAADFGAIGPSHLDAPPPLCVASWDIECVSGSLTAFPKASNDRDKIVCIATTFAHLGCVEPYLRVAVTLGECAAPDPAGEFASVRFVSAATEAELLTRWIAILREERADVMLGWNTWGFDLPYVHQRCTGVLLDDDTAEPLVDLSALGRNRPLPPPQNDDGEEQQQPSRFAPVRAGSLKTWTLQSGAFGLSTFSTIETPGIQQLDMMQSVKRSANLDSYALKAVTAHYLPEVGNKLDMTAPELFAAFGRGTPQDLLDIAQYCVRDTELPYRLAHKLASIPNDFEMSNACSVPVSFLLSRGQQVRVFSLIIKKARQMGYLCPDNAGVQIDGKYEGATVLSPVVGAHMEVVSCMDFASLYPTIMRAHNLCYSSIVLEPQYADLEGVQYTVVKTGLGEFKFAKVGSGGEHRGVLPALLEELTEYRKAARKKQKMLASAGDHFGASVANGAQLAFKVSSNSVYGFTGASKGFLPLPFIAASVTSIGRAMIEHTAAEVVRLNPGARVIYGDTDSVMVILKVEGGDQTDLRAHFELAESLAATITKGFVAPIELEFEKCMYPYLLYKKKRYASLAYTSPEGPPKLDVKGIALVRRDYCALVKDVSQEVLDALLRDRSTEKALAVASSGVLRLLQGEVPIDKLTITKAYRTDYKVNTVLPHASLATKLLARTGVPVASGTRIPFVFAVGAQPDCLGHLKAEDPAYVLEHGVEIDLLHYLDGQLSNPISSLLEVVSSGEDPMRRVLGTPEVAPLLKRLREERAEQVKVAKRLRTNEARRQPEITSFFVKK